MIGGAGARPDAQRTFSVTPSHAAFASARARLDLRILVLDDGDSGVAAMKSRLDEEGVSYLRVNLTDAGRRQLSETFLTSRDGTGSYGKFSGVVLPNESPAGLSDAEKVTLAAYERAYSVRQVASYTWPNPALGYDWPRWSGVVDGMTASVTPAAKTKGWGYLKGPVTLDDGDPKVDESYGYLAPALPADQLPPGQRFTPLLTAPIPGTDDSGVLMGEFADNPSNISNWIRMDAADVTALVAWQRKSGIKIDQAFNGDGSGQYAKASGRPDLSVKVPVYDIDWEDTAKAQVGKLRASGRHAICYLSAGSWEDWRSDAGAFPDRVKGRPLSGWKGERWLDTRALKVLLPIMGNSTATRTEPVSR